MKITITLEDVKSTASGFAREQISISVQRFLLNLKYCLRLEVLG